MLVLHLNTLVTIYKVGHLVVGKGADGYMSLFMNPLFGFSCFIILTIIACLLASRRVKRKKRIINAGFEFCGHANGLVAKSLWVKDGEVYMGIILESLVPVEIIRFSEITRGTKLRELEIRCRIDGEVKSYRLKGSENELLTYMDRLGYS